MYAQEICQLVLSELRNLFKESDSESAVTTKQMKVCSSM